MFVFSRSTSRVPQATLVLLLFASFLLSPIPGANAAPTPVPSAPTTTKPDKPNHRSGLPVPALLAIVTGSLTVILLGATLAFMYVRRRRAHQKRTEHRERTWQFQEMHRSGARPHYAGGSVPSAVSLSLPKSARADEKRDIMGPRYPIKAYVM